MQSSKNRGSITETISVGNIDILVIKKNIKNMHLSVLPPNGKVRITVPRDTNNDVIQVFALTKLPWINLQIKKFGIQLRQTQREYVTGESHFFWGKRYRLLVEHTKKPSTLRFVGDSVILAVDESSTVKQREEVINSWYRKELKQRIPSILKRWENILGVEVKEFRIKNMKTRWGTCNTSCARIWINLQLAKKPPKCLEYIVVHEMTHLLEKTHNKNFVALMDKHLPDWRITKSILNDFVLDKYKNCTISEHAGHDGA